MHWHCMLSLKVSYNFIEVSISKHQVIVNAVYYVFHSRLIFSLHDQMHACALWFID